MISQCFYIFRGSFVMILYPLKGESFQPLSENENHLLSDKKL